MDELSSPKLVEHEKVAGNTVAPRTEEATGRRTTLRHKADDFDAARATVDDAGSFVRGLWVTYVILGTYVTIAAASVTHRQLFLETPVALPLLKSFAAARRFLRSCALVLHRLPFLPDAATRAALE